MDTVITGIVQQGKRLGRTLGFPTANLAIPHVTLPEDGVYVGKVTLEDQRTFPCVLNQGKHPTLPEGNATIEVHLLGFEGDLYDKRITIHYLHRLRPERKFSSVEELTEQIRQDKREAERWFEKNGMNR